MAELGNGESAGAEFISYLVLIPAYKPGAALAQTARALVERGVPAVLIVDDGSGPEFASVFSEAAALPRVTVTRHAVNMGKGAALKTGMNAALCAFPNLRGVVTADADGQHHPDDIEGVAKALAENPEALVLGSRGFRGDVPLRSRLGNNMTRGIMRALLGGGITDTQTGLRGIPAALLPRLLRIESSGYEFELEMLLTAHRFGVHILERPIRTIYEEGNPSSHFNPLIDSLKIYFVLVRYVSVSVLTALIDNAVFYIAFRNFGHILLAQILGRICAVTFNYAALRKSVFYSRQRHHQLVPRFLALVVVSGSISYLGIRELSARAGMNPFAAKILVETILFFVNFTVARLFIFRTENEMPGNGSAGAIPSVRHWGAAEWLATAAVAAAAVMIAMNFRDGHLLAQHIWDKPGPARLGRFSAIYLCAALPMLALAPRAFAPAMFLAFAALSALALGPAAALGVIFFLLSSFCLGWILLGRPRQETAAGHIAAMVAGAAVYATIMYGAARLPVNYTAVWIAALGAPVVIGWRRALERLKSAWQALLGIRMRGAGVRLAAGLVTLLLGMQWYAALTPESGDDALAMHLAIPANIAAHHSLTYGPDRFIWSVMPMGTDFMYSITYMMGGEGAARMANFAMLAAAAGLLYCALRRRLGAASSLLLTGAFVSSPLVQLVTGSLFVENFQAALVLASLACLWHFGDTGERRFFLVAAVLAGAALNMKFGSLAFVAAMVPLAIVEVRNRRGSLRLGAALLALGLFVLAAAPPYAIAWAKTGNPLFPFLNNRFHSPLLPKDVSLVDARYRAPIRLRIIPDLVLQSSKYYEGQDGSFGFQHLLVIPFSVVALAAIRKRSDVGGAALVALGGGLAVLLTQPNARYLYPSLPLALIAFGGVAAWLQERNRLVFGALMAYTVGAIALNVWFLPSSSYYHKDFGMPRPFSRAARVAYMQDASPIRAAAMYINRTHAGEAVLLTSDSAIADLQGDVYENHWHQVRTADAISHADGPDGVLRQLAKWNVRYVIARVPETGGPTNPESLAKVLETCATAEFRSNFIYVGRIQQACFDRAAARQ